MGVRAWLLLRDPEVAVIDLGGLERRTVRPAHLPVGAVVEDQVEADAGPVGAKERAAVLQGVVDEGADAVDLLLVLGLQEDDRGGEWLQVLRKGHGAMGLCTLARAARGKAGV